MSRGFKCVLVIIVLVGLLDQALGKLAASSRWVSYTSPDGGYAVTLPGKPVESTRTTRGPSGPIELRFVATQAMDGSGAYGVGYLDYPASARGQRDAESRLDAMTHAFPGQMLSNRVITVDGHPGREFSVRRTKGVTTMRVFLVRQRLYELIATSPEGAGAETLATFLNSFRLLPRA